MTEISIAHSIIDGIENSIYSAFIGTALAGASGAALYDYVHKKLKYNQQDKIILNNLWGYYLSPLIDYDCQRLVGYAGGGPTMYGKEAAKSDNIIQAFIGNILFRLENLNRPIPLSVKPTHEILADKNKNIIIQGGAMTSDICKEILFNEEMRYAPGFLYTDTEKYFDGEIYPEQNGIYLKKYFEDADVKNLREERLRNFSPEGIASYDKISCPFLVLDRFEQDRVISKPIVNKRRGTYTMDSAIITYFESPLNKERDILLISGLGDMGTYLGNLILRNPIHAKKLCREFDKKGIKNGDYFQAIIEFDIMRYDLGKLPRKIIKGFNVKEIYKFKT